MSSRTRTQDDRTLLSNMKFVNYYCDGSSVETAVAGNYVGETKTTTDVVTPNFFERKRKGHIINNHFHSLKQEYGYSVTDYEYKRSAGSPCTGTNFKSQKGFSSMPNVNMIWNHGTGNALDQLQFTNEAAFNGEIEQQKAIVGTRAYAGVVPPEIQGLTELAEWTKTLRLVKEPLTTLKQYISRVKRTKKYKRSRAKDLGSFISDEWLVMRYGFTPLVLAVNEGMKAVTTERRSKRQTARSSSVVAPYSEVVTDSAGSWAYSYEEEGMIEATATVRAGVLYEHTFALEDHFGVSLHDLPATLWEIFPYSFVIDWLVNAQDYIRATTPKAGVRHLADWITVEKTVTRSIERTYSWNNPANMTNVTMPHCQLYRTDIDKVRHPGATVKLSSRHKSLRFEAVKDWLHLADAISLITSSLEYR